jgi:NADH-quinone oxidoreductase subunit L
VNLELLRNLGLAILLLPLAGAVAAGALGPRVLRGRTHWPVIIGVGGAAVCAIWLFLQVRGAAAGAVSAVLPVYEWFTTGAGTWFGVQFLVDPLTAVMLVTVTCIALLVVIYSRDYMRHHDHPERGYERFFAYLGLFVFSMCALVLGGNFLLLYLGWEAVGLCSYLLIGFYYDKPAAAAAAKKAFLVNRVGDFGFGLGILLIYLTFGSVEYATVFDMVQRGVTATGEAVAPEIVTAIAMLLLCGACGKSAQLPLHVWLPDAMEGPSPVSALIHAATMVTAGIYMIVRCWAIFTTSATAMAVVAVIGAATALFAATIAVTQTDMKRILAYSTISQLGYMFLALGVGAAGSAVFHLFTHAFFKALLFLGAGSVMHAMGGVIDVRRFSGLRRVLPWTFRTFLVGSLALAGVPFFSGFFSKDEIIHHAFTYDPVLGVIGLVTAALTAFYTFRMVFLAFAGEERFPEGVHPHESGGWMLVPLGVLSIGAVGAGYLGWPGHQFHNFIAPVIAHAAPGHAAHAVGHAVGFWAQYGLMVISGAIALGAILLAYLFYVRMPWVPAAIRDSAGGLYVLLRNKYFVDEAYDAAIIKPARSAGRAAVGIDDYLIDGLLWVITAVPRGIAMALRTLQQGAMQGYALAMIVAMAVIVWLVG